MTENVKGEAELVEPVKEVMDVVRLITCMNYSAEKLHLVLVLSPAKPSKKIMVSSFNS